MDLEHLAFIVDDPEEVARWYCCHLGMKIVREIGPPTYMRFLTDASSQSMLEIYTQDEIETPDYASMNPLILHVAFQTLDVLSCRDRLVSAGATPLGEINVTAAGDEMAMLRDPWGLAIQILRRKNPMI